MIMTKNKIQSGFSLIEVIISLSILLVIFSLIILEVDALAISKKKRYEYIASQIAKNQMESLRATPFDNFPSSGTISDLMLSEIPSSSGSFTVLDYQNFYGLKELSVTVNWNDGQNKSLDRKSVV